MSATVWFLAVSGAVAWALALTAGAVVLAFRREIRAANRVGRTVAARLDAKIAGREDGAS